MKDSKNRVLFIVPPLSSNKAIKVSNHQIPMGFLYMAGMLEKHGFEAKVLDCPVYYNQRREIDKDTVRIGLFPGQIEKAIREFKPSIVGVSCSFTMFEADTFEIVNLVKKADKSIFVVVGGAHSSSNPQYVLRNKNIDMIVIGEGELTMLEIAEKIRQGKSLESIKGTALMAGSGKIKKFRKNPAREPIQNLDELEPAWHLIDFKKYFEHPDNYLVTIRSPSVNLITSRGCPGNCTFCSVQTVWGRRWRAMSAKKVVNQIEFLYKNHGVRHFRINDDNLTLDKKRIMEICNELIKRKLDIKWDTPSGVALWTLDEEVIRAMKKAGYYRITFGIESGSKSSLKYIKKNINLERAGELIEYCHKVGLWVASFFIIGFPYETKKEIKETVDYITNSKINFPFVFVAQPYPGTEMYEDFKKEGLLEHGFEETSTFILSKYHSKHFSAKELNEIRTGIYKKFYLTKLLRYMNPFIFYREFLSKVRSLEDIRYVYKIIKSLVTTFFY